MKDDKPSPRGTWCATYSDAIVLQWNQRKHTRTIPLNSHGSNVGTITTAPGYNRFRAFCAEIGTENEDPVCYDANLVSDDETFQEGGQSQGEASQNEDQQTFQQREAPLTTDFDLDGPTPDGNVQPPTLIEDEEDTRYTDISAEFLRWHHRLGHISPKKIRLMARMGILPKCLATCQVPLCTSCLFGKATKRPWRGKTPINKMEKETITHPGQCVSVDQLESSTPGLIAQMRGIPTKARYKVATVFVDHFSGLSYVHLQ